MSAITKIAFTIVFVLGASVSCVSAPDEDARVVGTWELRDSDGERIERMRLENDGSVAIETSTDELLVGTYEASDGVMHIEVDWNGTAVEYEHTYSVSGDSLARIALLADPDNDGVVGRYSADYRITRTAPGGLPSATTFGYDLVLEPSGAALFMMTNDFDLPGTALAGTWTLSEDTIEVRASGRVLLRLERLPNGDLGMNDYDAWGNYFGVYQRQ